jgi:hypothetical protein
MYILGPLIENALVTREPRDEKFATAVTVRATLKGKGSRKRKKIVYRYVNNVAVRQEGFIHRVLSGNDVKDRADAERKAKRYIAKHSVRKRTLENIEHRGIAFLRRGDAMHVSLPDFGFTGKQAICFLTGGTWRLQDGNFTMTVSVGFDDPNKSPKAKRSAKDKKTRDAKRTKRSKK